MTNYIGKRIFLTLFFVFLSFVTLIALVHLFTEPSLFLSSTSLQLPLSYRVKVTALFTLLYSVEYLPVILFVSFLTVGYRLKSRHAIYFAELKGKAVKKLVLSIAFSVALFFGFLGSWLVNATMPKLIQNFLKEQKVSLISTMMQTELLQITPQTLISLDKYNIYVNSISHEEKATRFHKAVIFERDVLSVLGKKDSKVTAILACQMIELGLKSVRVDNCFRQALINTAFFTSLSHQVYSFDEIENLLEKSLEFDSKENTPEFLKYFTYTLPELIEMAQEPSCPKNTYPMMFRRALFALAFFSYSLFGLWVALYKEMGLLSFLAFLTVFAAFLPTLGNYLLLFEPYGFSIFSATYLLPIVGSLVFFIYFYIKTKRMA